MLSRVKNPRWFIVPALLGFVGAIWGWGAGIVGGTLYIQVASFALVPLCLICAWALRTLLEEKSWADYLSLVSAAGIYLVLLGEQTHLCPCGFQPPNGMHEGIFYGIVPYDMDRCFNIVTPLFMFAFGGMLLPSYNRKTLFYRFAAFMPGLLAIIALMGLNASIGYHD